MFVLKSKNRNRNLYLRIQLSVSFTIDRPGVYRTNHISLLIPLFCCSKCGNHLVGLGHCNYGRVYGLQHHCMLLRRD